MTAFWLTISLLLHALSFWLIILLFLRLSRLGEAERRAEELEEAMTAYLAAWKEENERFLAELDSRTVSPPSASETGGAQLNAAAGASGLHRERSREKTAPMPDAGSGKHAAGFEKRAAERTPEDEAGEGGSTRQERQKKIEESYSGEAAGAASDYVTDIGVVEDVLELSFTQPAGASELVRRLYAEGATVEEIAKQLGKGKTEVELLLKFAPKTDR
ncbi:hypothetical protein [Geobacillus jurassicus]|uniref:Coupling factor for flagellin transcription and translation n=1 Tax=Geobacillus jurassicus TaxID=235932 RepID=A0ABV6GPV0_9BACL|nr:hypothetical protein [Geobacillus jurassicus]